MVVQKPKKRAASKRRTPAPRPRARARRWEELSIEEKIVELGKRIPPDELARHPVDGAANLDHYIYGVSKDEPD